MKRDLACFLAWLVVLALCLHYGRAVGNWLEGGRRLVGAGLMAAAALAAAGLTWRAWRRLPAGRRARAGWVLLAAGLGLMGLAAWQQDPIERSHLLLYGVLAVLAHRLWGHRLKGAPRAAAAAGLCALVGAADELGQYFHPLRYGDWRDVITNAASAALVVAGLWSLEAARRAGRDRRG